MTVTLTARFWAKVTKDENDCWLWTGATQTKGYGSWGTEGRSHLTHRLTYEALVGPIPDGLTIDHLCRVKVCCNPAHLEPVSIGENTARARALITACPQGHEYTPENTLVRKGAKARSCRECNNARRRLHPAGEGRKNGAALRIARRRAAA